MAEPLSPRGMAQRVGLAASIAVAVGVCAPLTMQSEGVRTRPYLDPAHVRTVCYGETQGIEDRVYDKDECGAMLRSRLADAYAPKLVECMPAIVYRPRSVFAASLDASYNAGPAAVCRRMAPLFNSGFTRDACNSLRDWHVAARDRRTGAMRRFKGLEDRRRKEARLCLGTAS